MLIRALVHLLLTGTPRLRRRSSLPTPRVSRALLLRPFPDRLRLLRDDVWIAETRDIPGGRGSSPLSR